jgi:kynurenine formamidase
MLILPFEPCSKEQLMSWQRPIITVGRMSIVLSYLTLFILPLLSCEGDNKKKSAVDKSKLKAKKAKIYAVKSHRNIAYIADKRPGRRKLDLYIPKSEKPRPLFLYIHGGAWISGDKSAYSKLGKGLAAQGIAVAILNYRLSSRSNSIKHPAATLDGAAAFHWLRGNGKKYNYDSDCIVVGGHSAGGHMTGLLLLDPTYLGAVGEKASNVAGAIGIEGIYDIPGLVKKWPEYRGDFIERAFGSDVGWVGASPQNHMGSNKEKTKSRWLIIHSPKDELVDLPQSDNFVKALKKDGHTVESYQKLTTSHFDTVKDIGAKKDALTKEIVDFVMNCKKSAESK